MHTQPLPPTGAPLQPHERYYQATQAMHAARGPEQFRNRQAEVQEALQVLQQQQRYNRA